MKQRRIFNFEPLNISKSPGESIDDKITPRDYTDFDAKLINTPELDSDGTFDSNDSGFPKTEPLPELEKQKTNVLESVNLDVDLENNSEKNSAMLGFNYYKSPIHRKSERTINRSNASSAMKSVSSPLLINLQNNTEY